MAIISGCSNQKQQKAAKTDKYLAFTFDDAPSAKTEALLDLLREHEIKATFFLLGECMEWYPGKAELILAEGHELGNHSEKIAGFGELIDDKDVVQNSLSVTSEAIKKVSGIYPNLFRSHISYSDTIGITSYEMGMASIGTEIATRDWDKTFTTEEIINGILSCEIKDGGIILLHEHHEGDLERTLNALPVIIKELRSRGFQFLTVSELAKKKGLTLEPGHYYPGFY